MRINPGIKFPVKSIEHLSVSYKLHVYPYSKCGHNTLAEVSPNLSVQYY